MPYYHAPPQKGIPDPDTSLVLAHPTHPSFAPRSYHQQHQHQLYRQSRLTLMSLPDECLAILIHWVANQGVQDLYPLLCVNKRIFYHVVPILYRDPFRLSARWVWKRSVYKGVIERQTKLIRTLLLCCTRTITKITPIHDGSTIRHDEASSNSSKSWSGAYVAKAIAAAKGRRRGDKRADTAARIGAVLSSPPQPQQQQQQQQRHQQQQQQHQHRQQQPQQQDHAHASVRENRKMGSAASTLSMPLSSAGSSGRAIPGPRFLDSVGLSDEIMEQTNTTTNDNGDDDDSDAVQNTHPRSRLHALLHKLGSIDPATSNKVTTGKAKASLQSTHLQELDQQRQLWPPRLFRPRHQSQDHQQQQQLRQHQQQQRPQPSTVERIPIVWDANNDRSEQQRIPGLGRPTDNGKFFPPELAKTILRLADEPAPMANYLSYVTHTDVRSWSAASNMTLVHQILGDARLSWHVRLQILLNRTSRRIRGQQPSSLNQSLGGGGGGGAGAGATNGFGTGVGSTFINRLATHQDLDDNEDLDDDIMEANFIRRRGRYRRWRRDKRNKNLWGTADVNFVELLFLFYTSKRMESLSLGMNCSHWYHPSLDVLLPDIPERLSGLRRIVIDHADTIIPNAVPVPQLFIQRHQKAFPGQLREIQVRQSYHYSYDMSRSVLETIQRMDRLEVLDLSIWTGVFSGLDSIRTDHLRKLLICHHMDVPKPEVFDALLQRCMVLEELSIIVPHPKLFAWAVERRREAAGFSNSTGSSSTASSSALTPLRRRPPPQHLPPLRILTFFGHTPDVAGAFKDVMYAFQDTLESVQASMYPDLTKSGSSHFEVPVPHFAMPPDADENAPLPSTSSTAFFGIGILQDPLLQPTNTTTTTTTTTTAAADTPTNHYGGLAPPMLPLSWQDGGDHHSAAPFPSSASASPGNSAAARSLTLPGSGVSSPLTWDWPLPRLRTMSLRGPIVAHFDLGLLRFCPQLTDLALSYHCSRLPRLAYPAPPLPPLPSSSSSTPSLDSSSSSSSASSSSSVNHRSSPSASSSNQSGQKSSSFPVIMVCESLAFKWGLTLQDERRSLVIL